MNSNILRRRMASNKSEEKFIIEHPSSWYFEVETTSDNTWCDIFYATSVGTYYLDGKLMSSSYQKYKNAFGSILIPTAGYHSIWIAPNSWNVNSNVYRPIYNTKLLFLNSEVRDINTAISSVHTLYINKSNPTSALKLTNFTKVQTVYVPKEYIPIYKSTYPTLANKIKPCKFI